MTNETLKARQNRILLERELSALIEEAKYHLACTITAPLTDQPIAKKHLAETTRQAKALNKKIVKLMAVSA